MLEMTNHIVHSAIDFRTKTTKQLMHCLVVFAFAPPPSAGTVAVPFAWGSGTVQGVQGTM